MKLVTTVYWALSIFCTLGQSLAAQSARTPLAGDPAPIHATGADPGWIDRLSEDIRRSEYFLSALEPGVFSAPNRSQELRSRVSAEGLEVFPRSADAGGTGAPWRVHLRTAGFGRLNDVRALGGAAVSVRENRAELEHGCLVEWLENREEGIEQGWTISARPAGTDALWIALAVEGDLALRIEAEGLSGVLVDAAGEARLHYRDLRAFDATGRELEARLESSPEGAGVRVDDGGAVYPLTVDPLLAMQDWTAESDQANANFGISVSTAGDVDGDGYSDVIVGAQFYDNGIGETDEGRAYVYLGSATGLDTSPDWTAESNVASARFGASVSTAGDVDGDGFSDVIVGASRFQNGQSGEGAAYVYLGSSTGLDSTPDWTVEGAQVDAEFGFSVSTAGDVDGDGFSDVIVGAHLYDNIETDEGRAFVYLGSATGLSTIADSRLESDAQSSDFAFSVSTAGDVNGDGYDDVIVGAREFSNPEVHEGRAFVYLGSTTGLVTTPAWTAESDQAAADFGTSVSTAGDVNGDGYSDVIVGAPLLDNGLVDRGRAYVYLGSASGLATGSAWTAESEQAYAHFGSAVSTAGDVDGNGYSDVIVGANTFSSNKNQSFEGRAYAYLGSATGLETTPDWTAESNQERANFGTSVSTAGDMNGDGYSDVIVGAPLWESVSPAETNEGRAYAFKGSAAGPGKSPGWTAGSDQAFAELGISVSTAGDVNGDGFNDVIVGADLFDGPQMDEGRAYVYLGSAAGLALSPAWTAESDQASANFGKSVSTAGDVNSDGYGDVIVGAPSFDNNQGNEGRAYVYLGSATGLALNPVWTAESDQGSASFGTSVSTAGDVNGDGRGDVIVGAPSFDNGQGNEGRAFVYLGTATGLSTSPWTAESDQTSANFGISVATAGDVNRDGYGDVIVGADLFDDTQTDEGGAFVYLGSATGLALSSAWTAVGNQQDAFFGASVSTAGDVNGDGYSDVIVGAPSFDNGQTDEGQASVYLGSGSGLAVSPVWQTESDQVEASFGASVATAGDIDADGFSDVIVGANGIDNEQADEGRAYAYRGSSTGPATSPAWTAEGDQEEASFGTSVAAAGDVNGDGYADVIVGAMDFDGEATDEGGSFVYLGNEGRGGWLRALQQRRASNSVPIALLGQSESSTQFRIRTSFPSELAGFGWASGESLTAHLEWEVKELGVPLSGTQGGVPQLVGGSPLLFDQLVDFDVFSTLPYHWRARVRTNNPVFPVTPWVSLPHNAVTEAKLRPLVTTPVPGPIIPGPFGIKK